MSTSQPPPERPVEQAWPPPSPLGPSGPRPAPYSGYGDAVASRPTGSTRGRVLLVAGAGVAGIALGLLAGYVWSLVADPPSAVVTDQGVFLNGEIAYDAQVAVTLWFLVIGLVAGSVAGFAVALLGRLQGAVTVLAVVLLCLVACGVAAWTGIHLFGPDLEAQVAAAQVGDLVTTKLSIGSVVAYLGWPIGGLAGSLVGIALWPTDEKTENVVPPSSTVDGPTSPSRGDLS